MSKINGARDCVDYTTDIPCAKSSSPNVIKVTEIRAEQRTPSPPFGYSRECDYSHDEQVRIVALYAANRIRPPRIAYREGIDIALVEALIAGEAEQDRFQRWLAYYRKQRRQERLNATKKMAGSARFELESRIEAELNSPEL
ncbi:MAG: hypothetical protein RI942_2370 [Pseudomonadota bacterium]|jgi:hypothetical protein